MASYNFTWNSVPPLNREYRCEGVGRVFERALGSLQWWGQVGNSNLELGPFSSKTDAQGAVQSAWIKAQIKE